jgi:hypothetical protein
MEDIARWLVNDAPHSSVKGTRGKTPGTQVGISLLAISKPSIFAGFARAIRLQSGSSPGVLPLVRIR